MNGGTLTLQPGGGTADFTNASSGVLTAYNGGTIAFSNASGGTLTNNGLISVDSGSTITMPSGALTNFSGTTLTGGEYAVTAFGTSSPATLSIGGGSVVTNNAYVHLSGQGAVFNEINALATNAGTLSLLNQKQLNTSGSLTNTGTVALDAGSTWHIGGSFNADSNATLAVTVGGTQSQGAQSAGVLQVSGAASLGGNLVVTLAPGVQIAATDKIAIGSAASFDGRLANFINGGRLATADGSGSFQVNYGSASAYAPGTLILSDFEQTGANIVPAFFSGEANLGSAYYLAFRNGNVFGYYVFLSDPHYIYHQDLGYEYVFDAQDGSDGVYLYDFASSTFFYTSPTFGFPYLYDFNLNSVLYYYPDPNNPGRYNTNGVRYFYNFATGQIITK